MTKFTYFVSYAHRRGFGNCNLDLDEPWNEDTAEKLQTTVDLGVKDVVVLNYILISETEELEDD